ncbi:hemimethylated DNA-binding protein YccV [Chloropicon primus]|uniref:Hemimethylated DNA-binding domain-containing protein n=1 Tax=Chloropicon primus TaxID=1764295 RepID=A0A5B8MWH4_9CHLO|nr:hypothetical protein A3770_12p65130 [Chloropicon primus]UPR03207.1 hemimethylated DNA-binding protein YccV [Chloropicon primus]|eukprot:QDZ23995.1 hypothetical protein A3770_12p65130 [Chloropicon primus]
MATTTAAELPRDALVKIFEFVVVQHTPHPLRSRMNPRYLDMEAEREAEREEPVWIDVGRVLASCACSCSSWRDALDGTSHVGDAARDGNQGRRANAERFVWGRAFTLQHLCAYGRRHEITECFGTEAEWRLAVRSNLLWLRRIRGRASDMAWPNRKDKVLQEVFRGGEAAERAVRRVRRNVRALLGVAEGDLMEYHNKQCHHIGLKYWSDQMLGRIRVEQALGAMARASCGGKEDGGTTSSSVAEGQGSAEDEDALWQRLCQTREEVYIEEGAVQIASISNLDLRKEAISGVLDVLALELDRRLKIMSAAKRGEHCDPPVETRKSRVCQRRSDLSDIEQIACLNSVCFNETNGLTSCEVPDLLKKFRASPPSTDPEVLSSRVREDARDFCAGFHGLGLRGNEESYYDPHNSLIDHVLGYGDDNVFPTVSEEGTPLIDMGNLVMIECCGNPINLAVIYAAVGRRCGIPVRLVNAPMHFVAAVGQDAFVDVFFGGEIRSKDQLVSMIHSYGRLNLNMDWTASAAPKALNLRLCINLVDIYSRKRTYKKLAPILRLALALHPNHPEMLMSYAKVQAVLDNYDEAIESLNRLGRSFGAGFHSQKVALEIKEAKMLHLKELTCKRTRNENIRFKIGMTMRHTRYNYRGVIYGWDFTCAAGEEWIKQMGVDDLPGGRNQPFYKVLVDCMDRNLQSTYVAQENITLDSEIQQIKHPDVGRYFDYLRFASENAQGQRYVPNDLLRSQYPEN